MNNPTYPLLRFGTGDLSALDESSCACGRTAPRLVRIMGRVGDAVKVRGMFVHPRQLEELLSRFAEVRRFQAIVDRVEQRDVMRLRLELAEAAPGLGDRIAETVRDVLHVRPDLEVVTVGSIPEDAKRLVDERTWT